MIPIPIGKLSSIFYYAYISWASLKWSFGELQLLGLWVSFISELISCSYNRWNHFLSTNHKFTVNTPTQCYVCVSRIKPICLHNSSFLCTLYTPNFRKYSITIIDSNEGNANPALRTTLAHVIIKRRSQCRSYLIGWGREIFLSTNPEMHITCVWYMMLICSSAAVTVPPRFPCMVDFWIYGRSTALYSQSAPEPMQWFAPQNQMCL